MIAEGTQEDDKKCECLFNTYLSLYTGELVDAQTQLSLIYVFPKKKLRGLSPNFHFYVSVSNLYITPLGLPIFLQQNRQTDRGNIEIAHRNRNV